ncbi:hypothetical protein [Oryzobacter telluris]|uniref:hypothetical protein n=1 Tax=Oryzobacter telluris TaxID=3149179 RepID=UPI00370D398C
MPTRLSRTGRRTAGAAAAVVVALGLVGCTGDPVPPKESAITAYTPVPDDQLFDRVRDLPGVTGAKVSFRDNLTDGALYSGALVSDGTQNPYAVLDAAAAVLRQGRPRAGILLTVEVPREGEVPVQYTSTSLLDLTVLDPLTARYGPQPGSGEPPTATPVPTPSGWTPAP